MLRLWQIINTEANLVLITWKFIQICVSLIYFSQFYMQSAVIFDKTVCFWFCFLLTYMLIFFSYFGVHFFNFNNYMLPLFVFVLFSNISTLFNTLNSLFCVFYMYSVLWMCFHMYIGDMGHVTVFYWGYGPFHCIFFCFCFYSLCGG